MSEDTARVTVTYSAADIAMMNLIVWPFWAGLVAFIAAMLISTAVIFGVIDGQPLSDAIAQIDWALIGWALLLLIGWLVIVTLGAYWWRRRKGLHGPISFALTDEGVSFRNRHMNGNVFWNTIRRVKADHNRLFLFVTYRSALIIPRRAFATGADFARFVALAEDCWNTRSRLDANHA